jgi:hypothetical protein
MSGWPCRPRRCPRCSAADSWDDGQLWRTIKPVPRVVRWVVVHQCGICRHVLPLPLPPLVSGWVEWWVALWRACPPDAPAQKRVAS